MPKPDAPAGQFPTTETLPGTDDPAIPLPADARFDEYLIALDDGFDPARGPGPVHRARSIRVLALAVLAVLIVLLLTNAAAAAAWELSGERYVDEIVRDNL